MSTLTWCCEDLWIPWTLTRTTWLEFWMPARNSRFLTSQQYRNSCIFLGINFNLYRRHDLCHTIDLCINLSTSKWTSSSWTKSFYCSFKVGIFKIFNGYLSSYRHFFICVLFSKKNHCSTDCNVLSGRQFLSTTCFTFVRIRN